MTLKMLTIWVRDIGGHGQKIKTLDLYYAGPATIKDYFCLQKILSTKTTFESTNYSYFRQVKCSPRRSCCVAYTVVLWFLNKTSRKEQPRKKHIHYSGTFLGTWTDFLMHFYEWATFMFCLNDILIDKIRDFERKESNSKELRGITMPAEIELRPALIMTAIRSRLILVYDLRWSIEFAPKQQIHTTYLVPTHASWWCKFVRVV